MKVERVMWVVVIQPAGSFGAETDVYIDDENEETEDIFCAAKFDSAEDAQSHFTYKKTLRKVRVTIEEI
jgi:hypothetical protein